MNFFTREFRRLKLSLSIKEVKPEEISKFHCYGALQAKVSISNFRDFIRSASACDLYCVRCKKVKTYNPVSFDLTNGTLSESRVAEVIVNRGNFNQTYECPNCNIRFISFVFIEDARHDWSKHDDYWGKHYDQITLVKCGQNIPSKELSTAKFAEYNKFVGEDITSELTTSLELNSQKVGVGSVIYLRRILEKIVILIEGQLIEKGSISNDNTVNNKMLSLPKKIKELSKYTEVPRFMYDSKGTLYSILSESIHSLTDEECSSNFDTMKDGVLILLDDYVLLKKRDERSKRVLSELNILKSNK